MRKRKGVLRASASERILVRVSATPPTPPRQARFDLKNPIKIVIRKSLRMKRKIEENDGVSC